MNEFATNGILPPPPAGAIALHDREYRVRAFRLAADRILVQGAVRDQKPPRLYLRADPDPLTVHHMIVSLEVTFPDLVVADVVTHIETHPREECPTIESHYGNLVGISIARGFTHRVRDLFGGPRGCTHTTALLQAMAPVAVQCFWSMRAAEAQLAGLPEPLLDPNRHDDPAAWRRTIDTCHVWSADGAVVAERIAGIAAPTPVFLRSRLAALGIDGRNGPEA